jgi:hypothetical protein
MGGTCHVFVTKVTNKVNMYLGDACHVFVTKPTNKINLYSGAT